MLTRIPEVVRGMMPTAQDENALRERVNRLSVGPIVYAPPGQEVPQSPEVTWIDLYELTSDPTLDADSKEYKATGKMVWQKWCAVDGSGHWVADSYSGLGTKLRARVGTRDDQTLWLVTCPHDANQEATSAGSLKSGDRVFVTVWGKWYVVLGSAGPDNRPADEIEFELIDALDTVTANATATVLRYSRGEDPGATVEVYNFEYDTGKYDFDGPIGARGFAHWDDADEKYRIYQIHLPAMPRLADQYWIGVDDDNYLVALHPSTANTAAPSQAADPAVTWWCPFADICGLAFDDAGNFIGAWDTTPAWQSPWGLPDPNAPVGLPGTINF